MIFASVNLILLFIIKIDTGLFFLSLSMQRRKGRQGDRLFVPPSSTVLKYRNSEALRGKLANRCLLFFKKV